MVNVWTNETTPANAVQFHFTEGIIDFICVAATVALGVIAVVSTVLLKVKRD